MPWAGRAECPARRATLAIVAGCEASVNPTTATSSRFASARSTSRGDAHRRLGREAAQAADDEAARDDACRDVVEQVVVGVDDDTLVGAHDAGAERIAVSGSRLAGSWLLGLGMGSLMLAAVRGGFASLAFPFLVGGAGFLLMSSGQRLHRFPSTDFERGLDRLFALLLPIRDATTPTTVRGSIAQQARLAVLRNGVRRWAEELQLIKTDGYETASRISALHAQAGEQDDRALAVEAVRVLRAERTSAGADPAFTEDPISMLAYGLGARPPEADLTSLEDLLSDLGLSGEGDELRTHFDDIVAAQGARPHLRNDAQRTMFRDLAGASFVLGAAARILELASFTPVDDPALRIGDVLRLS